MSKPQVTLTLLKELTNSEVAELREQFAHALTGKPSRPHSSGESEVLMGEPVVVWPPVN
jgi:hypothetical protein